MVSIALLLCTSLDSNVVHSRLLALGETDQTIIRSQVWNTRSDAAGSNHRRLEREHCAIQSANSFRFMAEITSRSPLQALLMAGS